jgi:3-dehydroquinate dehydratase type I
MTPQIVGVIFSRADFHRALRLRNPPDLFELRLDRLNECIHEIANDVARLPAPLIITARDEREGGAPGLSAARRRALLLEFLPRAAYVDIELRSAAPLRAVLESAAAGSVRAIISFHDFKTTPPAARLDEIAANARSLGAKVVKIATRTDTRSHLHTLLDFYDRHRRQGPLAAMGIGKLGRASRLELARRGSVLNYAHLGSAAVPGQLSIRDLRRVLP